MDPAERIRGGSAPRTTRKCADPAKNRPQGGAASSGTGPLPGLGPGLSGQGPSGCTARRGPCLRL